jgi:hypothetical protein
VASNRIESEEENDNESNVTVSNNQFKNTQSQLKEVIDNSNTDNTNNSDSEYNIQTNSLHKIEDLKVEKLIQLANKDEYPLKLLIIEGKKYFNTPVCHFFKLEIIFINKPKNVKFECKIKNCELNCSFGELTN